MTVIFDFPPQIYSFIWNLSAIPWLFLIHFKTFLSFLLLCLDCTDIEDSSFFSVCQATFYFLLTVQLTLSFFQTLMFMSLVILYSNFLSVSAGWFRIRTFSTLRLVSSGFLKFFVWRLLRKYFCDIVKSQSRVFEISFKVRLLALYTNFFFESNFFSCHYIWISVCITFFSIDIDFFSTTTGFGFVSVFHSIPQGFIAITVFLPFMSRLSLFGSTRRLRLFGFGIFVSLRKIVIS